MSAMSKTSSDTPKEEEETSDASVDDGDDDILQVNASYDEAFDVPEEEAEVGRAEKDKAKKEQGAKGTAAAYQEDLGRSGLASHLRERLRRRAHPVLPPSSTSSGRSPFSPGVQPSAVAREAISRRLNSRSSIVIKPSSSSESVRHAPYVKTPPKSSLSARLNLRSRPPLPKNDLPFPISPTSEPTSSTSDALLRSALAARLNSRSTPPQRPPIGSPHLSPRRIPLPPDDDPEPVRTPEGSFNESSESLIGAFSPHARSLNSSMASLDEDTDEVEENVVENPQMNENIKRLDTAMTDRLLGEQAADEPMDWDDIDQTLISDLDANRSKVQTDKVKVKEGSLAKLAFDKRPSNTSKKVFVVVDTNIFIAQLVHVKNLVEDPRLCQVVTLYVPWTVMRELDGLKESSKEELAANARRAIDFLYRLLVNKSSNIRGQTGREEKEAQEIFDAHNPDDRILQACLKLRSGGTRTILYTNDKNLANKAMLNKIDACHSRNIQGRIEEEDSEETKESPSKEENVHNNNPESSDEGNNGHLVFTSVWNYLADHTVVYCSQYQVNHGFAGADQVQQFPSFDDGRLHLGRMANLTVKLARHYREVLQVPRTVLSVNLSPVKNLVSVLQSFSSLNTPAPYLSPTPSFPAVQPAHVVNFFLKTSAKTLENALGHLTTWRALHTECLSKIRPMLPVP